MNNTLTYRNDILELNFERGSAFETGYYAVPVGVVAPEDDCHVSSDDECQLPGGMVFLHEDFDEAYRILAVRMHRDEWEYDTSVYDRDHTVKLGNKEWRVLTDSEADTAWDESLDSYIDDCMEIPEQVKPYFDREKFKDDAKHDGRGHSLNSYDGEEIEVQTDNGTYYLYRQN